MVQSVSEGSAVVAVKDKFGMRQQLPLLDGEPEPEGVRSEPVNGSGGDSLTRVLLLCFI